MSQGLICSVLVLVDSFVQVVEFEVTEKLSKSVQKKSTVKKICYAICQQQFTYLFIYLYSNYQIKKNNK